VCYYYYYYIKTLSRCGRTVLPRARPSSIGGKRFPARSRIGGLAETTVAGGVGWVELWWLQQLYYIRMCTRG